MRSIALFILCIPFLWYFWWQIELTHGRIPNYFTGADTRLFSEVSQLLDDELGEKLEQHNECLCAGFEAESCAYYQAVTEARAKYTEQLKAQDWYVNYVNPDPTPTEQRNTNILIFLSIVVLSILRPIVLVVRWVKRLV